MVVFNLMAKKKANWTVPLTQAVVLKSKNLHIIR